MVAHNEPTKELETIRETLIPRFIEMFFAEMHQRFDMQAITAVIGAVISYLVTRSGHIRWHSAVDLQSEAGWKRLEDAIEIIVRGAFEQRR
ncbi:MAG: hypothetical protein JSW39_16680 [Desulfobacterales bacterium]|nr:MAG: hypothetical protein JSW39_16680 [Desulfobacterales bacterium]